MLTIRLSNCIRNHGPLITLESVGPLGGPPPGVTPSLVCLLREMPFAGILAHGQLTVSLEACGGIHTATLLHGFLAHHWLCVPS